MKAKNISITELYQALQDVNDQYGYQIEFKSEPTYKGHWIHFTLKSPSKVPGARVSHSGRNLPCASWHAHGFLFDEILAIRPDAIIKTFSLDIYRDDMTGETINNWVDWNCGSMYAPCMLSSTSILSGRE